MEEKSILIQSDEITKSIMDEIQEDMGDVLSKISKNMSDEIIEKLRPIEKKINDLRGNFQEFQEEEFEEKLGELDNSIAQITKSLDNTIEAIIHKSVAKQNKEMFESIEQRLAILGLKVVKDAANNKEAVLNKIDGLNIDKLEEKIIISEKLIRDKIDILEESIENNLSNNTNLILEKINNLDEKIVYKDVVIELLKKFEDDFNKKLECIQEELEWGNKSFFARLFGKRRK